MGLFSKKKDTVITVEDIRRYVDQLKEDKATTVTVSGEDFFHLRRIIREELLKEIKHEKIAGKRDWRNLKAACMPIIKEQCRDYVEAKRFWDALSTLARIKANKKTSADFEGEELIIAKKFIKDLLHDQFDIDISNLMEDKV